MTKNIAFKDVNQGTELVTGTLPLTPLVIEGLEDFKGSFDRLRWIPGTGVRRLRAPCGHGWIAQGLNTSDAIRMQGSPAL
jgi:hypothetical protein